MTSRAAGQNSVSFDVTIQVVGQVSRLSAVPRPCEHGRGRDAHERIRTLAPSSPA